MCRPGYYHNSFVATHALERMMYKYIAFTLFLVEVATFRRSYEALFGPFGPFAELTGRFIL